MMSIKISKKARKNCNLKSSKNKIKNGKKNKIGSKKIADDEGKIQYKIIRIIPIKSTYMCTYSVLTARTYLVSPRSEPPSFAVQLVF